MERQTIEDLERRAEEITQAEAAACGALAAGMRELAVQLPEGSQLALTLAQAAKKVECWGPKDAALWGGESIRQSVWHIGDQQSRLHGGGEDA